MTDISFSSQACQLCRCILNTGLELKGYAIDLRITLINDGVITDEDSYATVMDNARLKSALLKYLSIGLSQDKKTSRYGRGIVSDFDLFHNMVTDKQFNDMLDSVHFDYSKKDDFHGLKKNRTNLRQWLHRLRNTLIEDFELPETPDKAEVNRAKKAKKNAEDIQKEVAMQFIKTKRIREEDEDTDMDVSDDATVVEYDDINSTHLSDVHGPEFENGRNTPNNNDTTMTMEASALTIVNTSSPVIERTEESFENEFTQGVFRFRHLFDDFRHGGTFVMRLNYPEGVDPKKTNSVDPCSVSFVITNKKSVVKWDTAETMDLPRANWM